MTKLRKIPILALVLGGLSALPACEVVRGSPSLDGTTYVLGGLEGLVRGTPKRVTEAAESVVQDEDLHVLSSAASGVDGKVVARTALDTKVEIQVERRDEETCKLSIRVGTLGDRELSRRIFEKIKAKL